MPRVKQSQLARARVGNEMSQSVAARMTRNKMRAELFGHRGPLGATDARPSIRRAKSRPQSIRLATSWSTAFEGFPRGTMGVG
jgi:hypothetical protein